MRTVVQTCRKPPCTLLEGRHIAFSQHFSSLSSLLTQNLCKQQQLLDCLIKRKIKVKFFFKQWTMRRATTRPASTGATTTGPGQGRFAAASTDMTMTFSRRRKRAPTPAWLSTATRSDKRRNSCTWTRPSSHASASSKSDCESQP